PAPVRTRLRVRLPVRAIATFMALAAAGAAVVTVGMLYGPALWSTAGTSQSSAPRRSAPSTVDGGVPRKTTGELRVSSAPPGAQVRVDGKPRGVTQIGRASCRERV